MFIQLTTPKDQQSWDHPEKIWYNTDYIKSFHVYTNEKTNVKFTILDLTYGGAGVVETPEEIMAAMAR